MTTTISPSLGHAPLFTQAGTGASPGYDAIDFRRASGFVQEGVGGGGSWMVTQRGAGANLSVDIAANVDYAYVLGDAVSFQGLYPVPPHNAVINETISTANGSLPRVDRIILEVQDNTHDGSGGNLVRTRVVTGTATSGATLNNLTGAAAVPSSALLLADVLVGAGVTSITNANIRDRRRWAFGAHRKITRNVNGAGSSGTYSIASSTFALIDSTNLAPRIECSGAPLRLTLRGNFGLVVTGSDHIYLSPQVDSAGVDGMPSVGSSSLSSLGQELGFFNSSSVFFFTSVDWEFTPSAGSHLISVAWATGSGSNTAQLRAETTRPMQLIIEEVIRQDAANNSTTTG